MRNVSTIGIAFSFADDAYQDMKPKYVVQTPRLRQNLLNILTSVFQALL